MRFETLAVHGGHTPDNETGAVTQPINLSTTFEREEDGTFPHGYIYSRSGNPNRKALEESLALLEGGEAAAAFSSGSAATMSVFSALAPDGHVLAPATPITARPSSCGRYSAPGVSRPRLLT